MPDNGDCAAPLTRLPLQYYFDWSGIEDFSEYTFDARGIPRVEYGGSIGTRYNAITTAQYGLYSLDKWLLTRSDEHLDLAQAAAQWLVDNCQPLAHNAGGWIYEFDLEFYGPKAPWISAMAQGEAISLLLRMHQIGGDPAYLQTAERAFIPFKYSIEDGGVRSTFADGSPVFEEFPASAPPHVLNGHIFALLGVYDYGIVKGSEAARALFSDAVQGLKNNIALYDLGWWTHYDLHETRRLASRVYQRVHVRLLAILHRLTGDQFFNELAARWGGYLASPLCNARWFAQKVLEKIRLAAR